MKNARLFRDWLMNGLPCVWLQDEGGTSTCTPLPCCPLRGHRHQENLIFNCIVPPCSLLKLASSLYNQLPNEQEVDCKQLDCQKVSTFPSSIVCSSAKSFRWKNALTHSLVVGLILWISNTWRPDAGKKHPTLGGHFLGYDYLLFLLFLHLNHQPSQK